MDNSQSHQQYYTALCVDDGEENAGFETQPATGDWESHEVEELEKVTAAEYVNTQSVTRSLAVGDIAAYVEDKRRHDGFTGEFQVRLCEKHFVLLRSHYQDEPLGT